MDHRCGGEIKLIVGLGNPGREYESTRHNAGFMVVEKLLSKLPPGRFEKIHKFESMIYQGSLRGRPLWLQLPLTFMNLSGKAVAGLCAGAQILPEEILIVSDDLDLPLGKIRLRERGSDGGHNGLKSIIAELKSNEFKRLRVGIHSELRDSTVDFELSAFAPEEQGIWDETLDAAADAVLCAVKSGMTNAMNQYNQFSAEKKEKQ